MRSDLNWQWIRDDLAVLATNEVLQRWIVELPLCYLDGARVEVEATLRDDVWFISDRGGALAHSCAPKGVIGTMMGRVEGFFSVDMTGDGCFFLKAPAKPARTLQQRIDQAVSVVASYSVVAASSSPPPGWPPSLVITMTMEQALSSGALSARSFERRVRSDKSLK